MNAAHALVAVLRRGVSWSMAWRHWNARCLGCKLAGTPVIKAVQILQENPLLVYARDYLGDNLLDLVFIDDVLAGVPSKKAEVPVPGGHKLEAALWLNLSKAEPDCCFNLLHLMLATEAPDAGMLRVRFRRHGARRIIILESTALLRHLWQPPAASIEYICAVGRSSQQRHSASTCWTCAPQALGWRHSIACPACPLRCTTFPSWTRPCS